SKATQRAETPRAAARSFGPRGGEDRTNHRAFERIRRIRKCHATQTRTQLSISIIRIGGVRHGKPSLTRWIGFFAVSRFLPTVILRKPTYIARPNEAAPR